MVKNLLVGVLSASGVAGQQTDWSASGTAVQTSSDGQFEVVLLFLAEQMTALPLSSLKGDPDTHGFLKLRRLRHSGLVWHRKSGQPSSRRRVHSSPSGHG